MRILIVRVSSLGDVVHNLPVLADIHRHYPNAIIDWVVEEGYAGLIRQNRHVNEVIPFALRRWRKHPFSSSTRADFVTFRKRLKDQAYDWVFDTQGLLKTGIILGLSMTTPEGRKVGLGNKTDGSGYEPISRFFHDESIKMEKHIHVVQRSREMIARAMGYIINTPPDFGLTVPTIQYAWMPKQPFALFFHGTSLDSKKWAHQNWLRIGTMLYEKGLKILLPWGNPTEKVEAERLAADLEDATVLPQLSITDISTVTGRASFIVGVDTGLSHLAAAYNKPTVQIYCNIPRWRTCCDWSPKVISLGGENEIPSVEAVENAVRQLMVWLG